MNPSIPPNTRILIIEGIPGAGKTTLHNQLVQSVGDALLYDFHEEELLFGWKHGWIPGIEDLRLSFMDNFLTYCESILAAKDNAVFILNRFHLTYYFITARNPDADPRYQKILERLRTLPVHIYVPQVSDDEIERRAAHIERKDPIWSEHLQKRLAQRGFSTLRDMYSDEQHRTEALLKEQGIPYSLIRVEAPHD